MSGAPRFAEWMQEERYVAMRDGVELAVYLFRPGRDGRPVDEPLPVAWMHNRYHRPVAREAKLAAWLARFPFLRDGAAAAPRDDGPPRVALDQIPWAPALLARGFVVAFVDARGSGASMGSTSGPFAAEEAADAYDVTEWLAAQPFSTGAVTMFGRSYMGTNQLLAAAARPPHLTAVFPEMPLYDLYGFVRGGGIFRHDFARNWTLDVHARDVAARVTPLRGVEDGSARLDRARTTRAANRDPLDLFALPCRDDVDPTDGSQPWAARNPVAYAAGVRGAGIGVQLLGGWYDVFTRDAFLWWAALDGARLVVGPWAHEGSAGFDLAAEHAGFYELCGGGPPPTGDAPIRYYTIGAPPESAWRMARTWPVPEARPTTLYLAAGPSGSVASVNDGRLDDAPPDANEGADEYTPDPSTTSGAASRWTNGYGGPFGYRDLRDNDARALTWTTPPLPRPVEVTGHPIVSLWVTSTAEDGDFFAYLEEVHPDGYSEYVTEGALRASHRALGEPPFPYLGLPFHRGAAADLAPLGPAPGELRFDLHPISRLFPLGHRIRLAVTCFDRDNALTPELSPPPRVRVHRSARHPSSIELPIVPLADQPD